VSPGKCHKDDEAIGVSVPQAEVEGDERAGTSSAWKREALGVFYHNCVSI